MIMISYDEFKSSTYNLLFSVYYGMFTVAIYSVRIIYNDYNILYVFCVRVSDEDFSEMSEHYIRFKQCLCNFL